MVKAAAECYRAQSSTVVYISLLFSILCGPRCAHGARPWSISLYSFRPWPECETSVCDPDAVCTFSGDYDGAPLARTGTCAAATRADEQVGRDEKIQKIISDIAPKKSQPAGFWPTVQYSAAAFSGEGSCTDSNCGKIFLYNLNITSVPAGSFENMPTVTSLVLRKNAIKSLSGVVFPSSLVTLDLSDNKLESLRGVVWPESLKTLDLGSNNIVSLDGVTFPSNLTKLRLSYNKIESWPPDVFSNLASLKELDIRSDLPVCGGGYELSGYTAAQECRESCKACYADFRNLDANKDGNISKEEFSTHSTHVASFESVDTDDSGMLTLNEFLARAQDELQNNCTVCLDCAVHKPSIRVGSWVFSHNNSRYGIVVAKLEGTPTKSYKVLWEEDLQSKLAVGSFGLEYGFGAESDWLFSPNQIKVAPQGRFLWKNCVDWIKLVSYRHDDWCREDFGPTFTHSFYRSIMGAEIPYSAQFDCPAGFGKGVCFSRQVSPFCTYCTPGKFKDVTGLNPCSECPAHHESNSDRTACIPCPLFLHRAPGKEFCTDTLGLTRLGIVVTVITVLGTCCCVVFCCFSEDCMRNMWDSMCTSIISILTCACIRGRGKVADESRQKNEEERRSEVVRDAKDKGPQGLGDALCDASKSGDIDLVCALLKEGADVNHEREGRSAVALAAPGSVLEKLVSHIVQTHKKAQQSQGDNARLTQPDDYVVPISDADGVPPATSDTMGVALCAVSKCADIKLLLMLLDAGANVNYTDADGKTAVDETEKIVGPQELKSSIRNTLLEAGGLPSDTTVALDAALESNDHDLVSALLKWVSGKLSSLSKTGVDTDTDGKTFLCIASKWGRLDILKKLLELGADINCTNTAGETPLILASVCGQFEALQMLIASGADINCTNTAGKNPLIIALECGPFDIVNELLEKGADVNCTDANGKTALCIATERGQTAREEQREREREREEQRMKERAVEIEIETKRDRENLNIVEKLLEKVADVNCKNKADGKTALIIASQCERLNIVEKLLEKEGVDVNCKDANGKTATDLAASNPVIQNTLHHKGGLTSAELFKKNNIVGDDYFKIVEAMVPQYSRDAMWRVLVEDGLARMLPQQAAQLSKRMLGDLKDLRAGEFKDTANGLKQFLKVRKDWVPEQDEQCLMFVEEVRRLADCPGCVKAQADVLKEMAREGNAQLLETSEITARLAEALTKLQSARRTGNDKEEETRLEDKVQQTRKEIDDIGGWYYGSKNAPAVVWPKSKVRHAWGTYGQPMCDGCKRYGLDHSTIFADFYYCLHEVSSEKKCFNGVRDQGRAGKTIDYFLGLPQAKETGMKKPEAVSLRFYSSHSFGAVTNPLRDPDRTTEHPLAAITYSIDQAIRKQLKWGAKDADAASKEVVLYRGFSDLKISDEFQHHGGTEYAPMSTTTDVKVAVGYAIRKTTTGGALLMRIVTKNNLERGMDLQWISMFPGESERLLAPLTFMNKPKKFQTIEVNDITLTVVEIQVTAPPM